MSSHSQLWNSRLNFDNIHVHGWNNYVSPTQPVFTLFGGRVGSDLIRLEQHLLHV